MPIAWTKPACISWYREIAIKGLDGQLVYPLIMAPPPLDSFDSQIPCTPKPFGLLASKTVGKTFTEKVLAGSLIVRRTIPPKPYSEFRKWSTKRLPC
jgi:hypothetical protein